MDDQIDALRRLFKEAETWHHEKETLENWLARTPVTTLLAIKSIVFNSMTSD